MSNNKQMSVIDMLKQDLDIEIKAGVKMIVNWDGYKAMEKQQIEDAYEIGFADAWDDARYDDEPTYSGAEQYYNETFGGNNE
jgi:hypothetical protein